MKKKVITRDALKDVLKANKKCLAENSRLALHLSARLLYEKAWRKREEIEKELASLEEKRGGLMIDIEGITELLDLGVVDITIKE